MSRGQEAATLRLLHRRLTRGAAVLAVALAIAALPGCASVTYQRPGKPVTASAGEAAAFGRLRFFHDSTEFFPWNVSVIVFPMADTERHIWFLRLDHRAMSAEVHPDPNGSLAIALSTGDYALVGSTEANGGNVGAFYVVAVFRVPAGAGTMYAGDLVFRTVTREGGHWGPAFGNSSVRLMPPAAAEDSLVRKFGALPQPFVTSAWCVGDSLPRFEDPDLVARAKRMLDQGCGNAH